MNFEERQKMLSKEQIKMEKVGEIETTKEDEIRGLNGLIECMREFEKRPEKELEEIYQEWLKKIEEKYSTQ
jgi:hypothetical protein